MKQVPRRYQLRQLNWPKILNVSVADFLQMLYIFKMIPQLYGSSRHGFHLDFRVGHLIFRALALKMHSPGPVYTRYLQIIPFSSSYFNHGRPTCHFIEIFLVFVFSYFLKSRQAFGAFSFFSSSTTLKNPEMYFIILAVISLLHF